MLLGTVILTTGRGINNSTEVLVKTNFGLEAVSLATSTISEAQNLAFDQATINQALSNPNQLTGVGSLGFEGAGDDTLPDDFDDYNGIPGGSGDTTTVALSSGVYKVRTRVCYVDLNNLQGTASSPTWYKRMDVWVWSTSDRIDTIRMSAIYSYWYFR